jgi:hypothetical protein
MRPILALAIVLLGPKAALPEAHYQEPPAKPAAMLASLPLVMLASLDADVPFSFDGGSFDAGAPSPDGTDDANVVALPPESSDAAHDQDEAPAEPTAAPAPVSTQADAGDTTNSLDGLCNALLTSAQDNDLPVAFFANLIWQESKLKHDAVSPVGAQGIAQFMPRVAVEAGLADPFDPQQAIPASARFLHALQQHFNNLGFVAAAYNAGAHRVGEWLDHGRVLPPETQNYVLRITGRSAEAWRRAPVDDSRLAFVRPLPCRNMPAFAELEQAKLQQPPLADEPQPQQDKNTATVAAKAAPKIVLRQPKPATTKTANKIAIERRLVIAHQETRKETHKEARTIGRANTGVHIQILAGNIRGGRHEALPRPRLPHEKRRLAAMVSESRKA